MVLDCYNGRRLFYNGYVMFNGSGTAHKLVEGYCLPDPLLFIT